MRWERRGRGTRSRPPCTSVAASRTRTARSRPPSTHSRTGRKRWWSRCKSCRRRRALPRTGSDIPLHRLYMSAPGCRNTASPQPWSTCCNRRLRRSRACLRLQPRAKDQAVDALGSPQSFRVTHRADGGRNRSLRRAAAIRSCHVGAGIGTSRGAIDSIANPRVQEIERPARGGPSKYSMVWISSGVRKIGRGQKAAALCRAVDRAGATMAPDHLHRHPCGEGRNAVTNSSHLAIL